MSPVIRPVLDTTDIEIKSRAINNLINKTGSIGMTASIAYKATTSFNEARNRKDVQNNQNGSITNTNTYNNNFVINDASDPKKVAREVRNIIQKQVERENLR